jgi:hypothetical protein
MEVPVSFDLLFQIASSAALPGWLALIFLPRWPLLIRALRYGLIGALCLAYAVLVMVYFFRVEGGGFNSIAEVRALFASDPVLVAGWIHYLAFDLFVGLWIAEKADAAKLSRLLQTPILALTFLFGPAGLLAFFLTRSAPALIGRLGARFSTQDRI